MQNTPEHITTLWERYLSNRATPEEVDVLLQFMKDPVNDELNYACARKAEQRLYENGVQPVPVPEWMAAPVAPPMHVQSRRSWYVAAAVLVGMLGTMAYWLMKPAGAPVAAKHEEQIDLPAPQANRATITLANGSSIFLDSAANGEFAAQANARLVKQENGQIAYHAASGTVLDVMQYNTLNNPRGSRVIGVQLSDGSKVWLNAGSSVTYPVIFNGKERNVELKGEGYFEVAKDASRKFVVTAGGTQTEVLGTHFNVMAHEGEPLVKVTLLEGSIKVGLKGKYVMVKPGQQVRAADELKLLNGADLAAAIAWKNGLFNFDGLSLREAMPQLERWYDISVEYETGMPDVPLFGKIDRNLNLEDLLGILQGAGFHFRLEENRKLVLMK